jgi:hypothetical protein
MSGIRANGAWTGAALLLALALGGCSISIADLPLGSPADAPHAKDTGTYLPVNELPPDRDETAMNPAERAKIRDELVAARERQASAVASKDQAASKDQSQAAK